ncbi:hypothetical protein B0T13DRAFT_448542 [Neurospora crassa]|nr:hypothetical protein B0T13DRAFT_448542 [Neurospora crassa]
MADRGVKRNFDMVDPSSDSGDTSINNKSTRKMRESAPSPTSASDSEPRFHPTTNNPTTGGADMSWTAGPSNQATTSNVNPASNANIGYPDDTATLLRASYHTRQAAAIVLRLVINRRLALMKMVDHPDFPERFERFQRGEVDVESGEEADDEMEEHDEDMGEAEEEMDTEETEEAGEKMGEKMDTES